MPHQCTSCGRQFADGSKEMLSGCPDCGGTKFQFMPDGGAPAAEEPPEPPGAEAGAVAETVGQATAKLRDFVNDAPGMGVPGEGTDGPGTSGGSAERAPLDPADGAPEGGAQSTARSEMVDPEELPDGPASVGSPAGRADLEPDADGADAGDAAAADSAAGGVQTELVDADPDGRVVDTPSGERPDLSELREELNDQFEGIRIREPGQYELNLMELYEREETIIALQENGRYVIEPPESWRGDGDG